MKNLNPKILKILEIVLHVLGFPLLLAIAFILNINVIKNAAGYGISAFIFVIIIALFAIAYYVAYFILIKQEKKRREKVAKQNASAKNLNYKYKIARKADPARRTGLVLAIIAVCCLTGFWAFFDIAMPEPLATATSRTIFIEDLSDGWNERSDVNKELLDTYITRAYFAGKLTNKTLEEYLKEGVKNEDVATVMKEDFESIDKNGYGTFVGPSIDFAQNGRMTINSIIHLLLDEREPKKDDNGERLDKKISLTTYTVVKTNYVQEDQTANEVKIEEGKSYAYMRSNQEYFLYNENLNKAGVDVDGLVIYEEVVGYKKVQFLAGNSGKYNDNFGDKSYVYIIKDDGGSLDYVEKVYLSDTLKTETHIKQTAGGKVHLTINDEGDLIEKDVDVSLNKNGSTWTISTSSTDYDIKTAIESANIITSATRENVVSLSAKPDDWADYDNTVVLEKGKVKEYATWDVFDMLGTDTTFELPISMVKDLNITSPFTLSGAQLLEEGKYLVDDVLSAVSALISDENIVGSQVYVTLDLDTGVLAISPCNEERGTLDYMKQAWLDSNGLIFIIVSLFSLRKLCLAFAAFLALISYLIGMLREYRFRDEEAPAEDEAIPEEESSESVSEEEVAELEQLDQ